MNERIRPGVGTRALAVIPLILLGAFVGSGAAGTGKPGHGRTVLATDVKDGVRREVSREGATGPETESIGSPRVPMISFIDSPSATCVQPDPRKDECFIDWGYASVEASSGQYMVAMSFALEGKAVASVNGFFQTSMFVPSDMFGKGFKVKCGALQLPDPAVNPCSPTPCTDPKAMGNSYRYTIRARETGGLSSANFGTVSCPAFVGARYWALTPCRVLDTRNTPNGPLAGPALQPNATRTFPVSAASCGIPKSARAVSFNVTVTGVLTAGNLVLYAGGTSLPPTSTISFKAGKTRANNAIVQLPADASGTIAVTNNSNWTVHLVLDVNGYFD